jgi:hypothetical protein
MRAKRREHSKFLAGSCDHHFGLASEMFLQLAIGQVGSCTYAKPGFIFGDIHLVLVIHVKKHSKHSNAGRVAYSKHSLDRSFAV